MKSWNTGVAVVAAAVVMAIAGCAGLSPAEVDTFLSSIPTEIPDLSGVADGTYEGDYRIDPPRGATAVFKHVAVAVTVSSHALQGIEIIDPRALGDDEDFATYAARVVTAGSLDVDGVSGATYSSKAFAKAVELALSGAHTDSGGSSVTLLGDIAFADPDFSHEDELVHTHCPWEIRLR